jgi:hypothetical protein
MYWDVIEVKPERDYGLFVRFRDGLAGRVQLRREELTGVLAPLLDAQFFEQVFIDCGAVAWPGDIDLAPDAMYAQVASQGRVHIEVQRPAEITDGVPFRNQLPRFFELKDLLTDSGHPGAYFRDFEDRLRDPSCFATFAIWEKELQGLDPVAWASLKKKATPYLKRRDKKGRGWQQLFDFLGEASGYRYLRAFEGCSIVRFVPESSGRTPDLEGVRDRERVLCDVKTINISEIEVSARRSPPSLRTVSNQLDGKFFGKLDSTIASAKDQLQSYDPNGDAQHLAYINICFDDFFSLYKDEYLRQIKEHLLEHPPGIKVVVSPDVSKTETQDVGQRAT